MTWEDIYNLLMYEIEPELITDMIPELDEWYGDESEEEKMERGDRYHDAFEVLFTRLVNINDAWKGEIASLKDKVLSKYKSDASGKEEQRLGEIEDIFSD